MSDQLDILLAAQLEEMKAELAIFNSAIRAFASSNIQSYQLDTGQTRQLVTRATLSSFVKQRDSLLNDIVILSNRLCGGGTLHIVPGF